MGGMTRGYLIVILRMCNEIDQEENLMMRLTPHDEDLIEVLQFEYRVSIQAAAYTVYEQLTPSNKKPVSQRAFHNLFRDNWQLFSNFENGESNNTN